MVLKACGAAGGQARCSSTPRDCQASWRLVIPEPNPGVCLVGPYLVPHRFLRVHSKAAEHRQDLVGTVIHGVEIVCGSKAQDTRNPGRCKWVLSGPAEGGGEDPVSSLRAQINKGKDASMYRINKGPQLPDLTS